MSSKSAENIAKNIRDCLYDHIQRLPYEYHVNSETGELLQRCTSDVETIRRFLAIQLVEVTGSLFMLIFTIIIMINLNLKMALISISILPITFSFAIVFFTWNYLKQQNLKGSLNSFPLNFDIVILITFE